MGTPTEIKRSYGSGLILAIIFDKMNDLVDEVDGYEECKEKLLKLMTGLQREGVLDSFSVQTTSRRSNTLRYEVCSIHKGFNGRRPVFGSLRVYPKREGYFEDQPLRAESVSFEGSLRESNRSGVEKRVKLRACSTQIS